MIKYKKAFTKTKRCFFYSLFPLFITITPYICVSAFPQSVESFDIKGIKLGMTINEVINTSPEMSIEKINRVLTSDAELLFTKYFMRGYKPDLVRANIAKEQYGSGVFYVSFQKSFHEVDPTPILAGFKKDLVVKYGKPQYEDLKKSQNYFACWGEGCNKNFNNKMLNDVSYQYLAAYTGIINKGKYLTVTFTSDRGSVDVTMMLFDTAPYFREIEEKKGGKIHRPQEKIEF